MAGRSRYRATRADDRACLRMARPKPSKLARNPRLRRRVERMLCGRFSPQQISARLKLDHPDDPEMRIAAETIYQSLYVQSRGRFRKDLTRYLRTGRSTRKPRREPTGQGRIPEMVSISERPAEAEDRAVPGHWEGDLIVGKANRSFIGTLVERQTRFVILTRLGKDATTETVTARIAEQIVALARAPAPLAYLGPGARDGPPPASSPSPPESRSTSVIPTPPGNAAATRTPTACFASTSRREPTSQSTTRPSSTASPPSSTIDLGRPSVGSTQLRRWRSCCVDRLKPPPLSQDDGHLEPGSALREFGERSARFKACGWNEEACGTARMDAPNSSTTKPRIEPIAEEGPRRQAARRSRSCSHPDRGRSRGGRRSSRSRSVRTRRPQQRGVRGARRAQRRRA